MMKLSGCVSLTTDWTQVGNAVTSGGVKDRGLLRHVDSLNDADTDRLVECLRHLAGCGRLGLPINITKSLGWHT